MAIKVGIDRSANLKALRRLQDAGVIELRRVNLLEEPWPGYVVQQKKAIMLGYWELGVSDVLAGKKVHEVERIVGPGKRMDVAHIYAAHLNECEYFVTGDRTDFIDGGRRDALESLLGVKIRTTSELVQELAQE